MAALAGLLLAGLWLRLHGYTMVPPPSDNADELDWAWSGLTLITRHVPFGWSYLAAYPDPSLLAAGGTTYPVVHPYLDHPPLFSLLAGVMALGAGARDLTDVQVAMVRPLPIFLSVLAIWLAYRLGRRVLGPGPALIGAALLATAPGAVLLGREVESESLVAVLLLLALLCALRILEGRAGPASVAALVACCLLAPLAKVPGVAVAAVAAAILVTGGARSAAVLALAGGGLGLALYAVYGSLLDWQLFVAVLVDQGARRHGVMGAWEFIAAPAGVNRHLRDGWWLLGWLGLGAALLSGRRPGAERLLAWPALAYAAVILLLGDQRVIGQYGWYRVAVYPLVYLGAGWLAWEAVARPSAARLTALLALGGSSATALWLGSGGAPWMPPAWLLGAVLLAVLAPALAFAARGDRPPGGGWARRVAVAALAIMLVGNAVQSFELARIFSRL